MRKALPESGDEKEEQATTGAGAAEQDGATGADGAAAEEWEKKAEGGDEGKKHSPGHLNQSNCRRSERRHLN